MSECREIEGGLSVSARLEPPYELDDIAAGITASEASPEVFVEADDEGRGVVAFVEGAGTDERAGAAAQMRQQALIGQDLLDGNDALEMSEVQVRGDHDECGGIVCLPLAVAILGVPMGLLRIIGRQWEAVLLSALSSQVLTVAETVDVDAEGVHGEPVQDGRGERGVAQVVPPGTELDIGTERGRRLLVTPVEQIEQRVGGGGLVGSLFDLPEADIIDDEQPGTAPGSQPPLVAAVGESRVEVVE